MADFREYSAAFHEKNDDLMHYGVKNMRWHHHKRKPFQNVLDQRSRQESVEKYKTIGDTTLEDSKKQETKAEPEKKSNEVWSQAANVHRMVSARTPLGAAKNIAKLISGNTSNNPGKEQRKEAVDAKKESDRKKRHKKILTKKK